MQGSSFPNKIARAAPGSAARIVQLGDLGVFRESSAHNQDLAGLQERRRMRETIRGRVARASPCTRIRVVQLRDGTRPTICTSHDQNR